MFYAIDFDTRTVESKSKDGEDLAAYVIENDLSSAVAVVDNADEICLQFSLAEMIDLYEGLTLERKDFKDENSAATACWNALEEEQGSFPTFTSALGKKLLKGSLKQPSDKLKPEVTTKVKAPTKQKVKKDKETATRTRSKLDRNDVLTVVDPKCKQGSILHTIVTAIDDALCETVGDVIDYITTNHVIPKTGELADIKFAEHNINYFIKQGKISVEEGL